MRTITNQLVLLCCLVFAAFSQAQEIKNIEVRGNTKVERDAVLAILKSQKGTTLDRGTIAADIKALHDLKYFSHINFLSRPDGNGVVLIIDVKERPAITAIEYRGMEEVSEDDIKDKMATQLYTIVDDSKIQADLHVIEKMYAEKGFYLAKVTYSLEQRGKHDVALVFNVDESGKVLISEVKILGNTKYSDGELIDQFAAQPATRISSYGSGSIYADEMVKRDAEFLSFYYQDWGFAQVKVAKPQVFLDSDRNFVRVTHAVEEGLQYNVGKLDVTGDLLFPKAELIAAMKLKLKELFRYSRFTGDIEMLMDRYGDLGYAYADVNPRTVFNDAERTVDITYDITKGNKVYFGAMTIVGNTKTRDNVVRREMEVHDSELYSGTRLTESKKNINRLGFFEEVQVIKERDTQDGRLLNLKVKVKEKPTGQLQLALGYSPGAEAKQTVFGRGKYDEQNQSGRGWHTTVGAEWDGGDNYKYELGFADPKVNDSEWSLGVNATYQRSITNLAQEVQVDELTRSFGVSVGRRLIELVQGVVTYRRSITEQRTEQFILDNFRSDGVKSTTIFALKRTDVDNYIDPTEGSSANLSQSITGGFLGGDFSFLETSLDVDYYYPIDFTDTYRTYFKLQSVFAMLSQLNDEPVPFFERYRLGYYDLRGFPYRAIGPKFRVIRSPGGQPVLLNRGGDRKMTFQLEYFLPLIPKAGIKALVFTDMGRVYDDGEPFAVTGLEKDVGFGIRWITPIAPFRFEWAYPVLEDGSLGDMEMIWRLGY